MKNRIWIIPIEPLEERYSAQWYRWFDEDENWKDALFINGKSLTDKIECGSFLDVYSTNHYKASQVMEIAKYLRDGLIKEGDVLFFHDLWFPLEQIFYMLDGASIDVKVAGFLHAGSYDKNDFLYRKGMSSWALHMERGWLKRVDHVFVFSLFHERLVQQELGPLCNLEVVPFPYRWSDLDQYKSETKDIQVVFPHRLDPEKSPQVIELLRNKGIEVTVTKEICESKSDYWRILGRSQYAISWAKQETFGIAMAEAAYLGCMPLVPNRLSYPELFSKNCVFGSIDSMIKTIQERKIVPCEGPHHKNSFLYIREALSRKFSNIRV